MTGSLGDKSALFSFVRPDGRTLFDFQEAAAAHCAARLGAGKSALLALDTGLGKTCTVRSTLERLGFPRTLYICPGGLVRQVTDSLRRAPWDRGDERALTVLTAETGKQLSAAVAEDAPPHDVLVLNRALGLSAYSSQRYATFVVDEAHQNTSMRLVRHFRWERGGGSRAVLFVTATPEASSEIEDYFRIAHSGTRRQSAAARLELEAAAFIVRKTPRVMAALGVSMPRVVTRTTPLRDREAYFSQVVDALRYSGSVGLWGRLRLAATLARAWPETAGIVGAEVRRTFEFRVDEEDLEDMPRGDLGQELRELACVGGAAPPGLLAELELRATRPKRGRPAPGPRGCPCCGLTEAERDLLRDAHFSACRTPTEPPWVRPRGGFTSALVRFGTKSALEAALRAHPPAPDVLVFPLTTDKSAAYRARLVRRFASHDGQRAKLAVLARAAASEPRPDEGPLLPLLRRVSGIGMGTFFLREVEACLARPRVLVADSSVDVGFDLHRHIDAVYVPQVVGSFAELQQLTGRISRIATDVKQQGTVDVLMSVFEDSLDTRFFVPHLEQETRAAEAEGEAAEAARGGATALLDRARRLLSADAQALGYFNELLLAANAARDP